MKGAVHVREGVTTFRLVVDNDTTMHAVHTCTLVFSRSVLIIRHIDAHSAMAREKNHGML